MIDIRRWTIMMILCLTGGLIYLLPFMREIYYLPLQEALDLTNVEFGTLMTAFGITSMLTYGPGGWLADRYSPRLLITISMIFTGLGGLVFATFPSYTVALLIHAFWGITVTGTYWGAMIKATRAWGSEEEQGRAFGILEGGRGIVEAIATTAFLGLFAYLGSTRSGLSQIIIYYSISNIALGIAAWLVMDSRKVTSEQAIPPTASEIFEVLKRRDVWLIAIVIFTGYSAYWGSFYLTPYATDVMLMSVVVGGMIGAGKNWLRPFAAGAAGYVADKIGITKTVSFCFIILIASFSALGILPADAAMLPIVLTSMTIGFLGIFALRGIYFALISEVKIPIAVTGTAAGVLSVIGFTPDIFMPLIGGAFLDAMPGEEGYRYFFLFIAGICVIGWVATRLLLKRVKAAN
ncbi:MAG: MFS transporter [Porticoccaceae bacterium]|nr:MFS transporter [Porticoccaceae bacterium]|tara:strand:+ start:119 stop:1336 length:1218 start_codon:yes stop_codon:yes gene_type:complete